MNKDPKPGASMPGNNVTPPPPPPRPKK